MFLKGILAAFLFFLSTILLAQSGHVADSLKKYSYFLLADNNDSLYSDSKSYMLQGTGFYIKRGKKNIFMTANHVLSVCYNGVKWKNNINKLTVYNNDSSGLLIDPYWRFSIVEIKKRLNCIESWISPDTVQIEKTDNQKEFDLTSLAIPDIPNNPQTLAIFGFPVYKNFKNGIYNVNKASLIMSNRFNLFRQNIIYGESGKSFRDTINYHIYLYDFKLDSSLSGFSGAPVFVFDGLVKKWGFIGMFVASDLKKNTITVVKAKELFKP